MVRGDADGGTGGADGADGEADYELCVSVELGAVGTEECIGTVGREQPERAQGRSAVEKTSEIKSEYFFCSAEFSFICRRKPVLREFWKYTLTELEVYSDGAGSILLRKWGY